MSKLLIVLLLCISLVLCIVGFAIYQASTTDMSCGGDFSYKNECPFGTYCKPLKNQGPMAGGMCKPIYTKIIN